MGKSIEVENLNIYYGSFLAVEDVTMSIRPQTVTALIGPSGCGKSTFLRSINRMHEVIPGARVEGRLALDGQRPLRRRASTRSACGARSAWSSSGPTRSRRCRSTTTSSPGMRLNNKQGARRRHSTSWSSSRCAARTSGTRSRTASTSPARASPAVSSSGCASPARSPSQPDVLLMDEPCSALDPISTLAIEDLINELKTEYTIVIVTHNMQQAARVSDYTGFFNIEGTGKPGKLVEMDDTETIFSQPEGEGDRGLRVGPLRLGSFTLAKWIFVGSCRVRLRGEPPGSSMLSAPAHIPAITLHQLRCWVRGPDLIRDVLIDTVSAMISGSRVCSPNRAAAPAP